jgi:hypothetical protein
MLSENMEGWIVFFPQAQYRYGRYSVSGLRGKRVLCQNGKCFSFNENSLLGCNRKRKNWIEKLIGKLAELTQKIGERKAEKSAKLLLIVLSLGGEKKF